LVKPGQPARRLDETGRELGIGAPALAAQQSHYESALVGAWLGVGQPRTEGGRGRALPSRTSVWKRPRRSTLVVIGLSL